MVNPPSTIALLGCRHALPGASAPADAGSPLSAGSASLAEAHRYWSLGDTARAEAICREMLDDAPRQARVLHFLGLMADAQGRPEQARRYLEEACAGEGVSPGMLGDLTELHRRAGRFAEAVAAARRATTLAPGGALHWHRLALIHVEAGDLVAARDCLRRAVELEPDGIDARNNLGIVLQRLGELDAAGEMYRAALAIDGENAAAHSNLASLLRELGQFEAALDHARRAVALQPELVGAHVYAALAEAGLERNEAALEWLDRALALAPQSVPVLTARADLLRKLDRAAEALGPCRQAVALDPGNGEAHNTLGLISHALGDDAAAVAAFERAASLLPQPAMALANLATVLLELGRPEDGAASLERALAADPALAVGWYARADAKSFRPGDPDIAAMERLLEEARQRPTARSDSDRLLLHYALAKAYLDLKDGPRAFAHLNDGSRLKRARLAYEPEAAARQMAATAAAFPPELFTGDGSGDPSEAPVFILGMPRSGTTLVEQILASHPEVHGGGEARHVEQLVRDLGDRYPSGVTALSPAEIARLGRRYVELASAGARGASRVTDKMPNNFLHLGLIHRMLPRARIVHCRRNPVDTCLSCYSKLFTTGQEFSYDLVELGRYYRSYERLMAHWRHVLPADRFIEVEYESVVADLAGEARRLVQFCGLAWDDACLSFHRTNRPVRSASMNQVRQPLYRSSLGRAEALREQLGPLLAALAGG